jgi:hypothetical protein
MTTTTTPRTPTFYRQTAKETIAIAQASTDVKGLSDRLAFIATRIASFQAKGQKSKEQRWTRVSKVVSDRIAFLQGQSTATASHTPARANMTFVGAPKKAKKAKSGQAEGLSGVDAILAASGMSAQELLLALASRV